MFELIFSPLILPFQGHHKIPEELACNHLVKALLLYFVAQLPEPALKLWVVGNEYCGCKFSIIPISFFLNVTAYTMY